jgi:hypothetical protein
MALGKKLSRNYKSAGYSQKSCMRTLLLSLIFIGSVSLSLVSCGLSDDAPADSGVFDLDNLNGGCELNTENLNKILDEDVSQDIKCLETNLDQFVQFVRRENPNYIGRIELNRFIDKFFPESREVARDLLKLVYDLNTLLLKDPRDQLSVRKLKKLFTLFQIANNEGRSLNFSLKGLSEENYWQRRQEIFIKLEELSRSVLSVIVSETDANPKLKITGFIEELKGILDLNDDQLNVEKIKSFLFAKKLIIGGDKEEISSSEVVTLLDKTSDLVLLAMDAIFLKGKEFQNSTEEYYFYYDIVKELKGQFYPHTDTELIIEHKDIAVIVEEFLGDKYNISNMEQALQNVKEKFFGGAPDQYLFRDIMTVANWGLEFSGMLYFNEITYEHYQNEMNSPKAINGLTLPKIENYHVFPQWMIKRMWENYDYISSNYRFFHDDDGKSHFFNYFKRYRSGFQTASMLRWVIRKVVQVYGHYPPGKRKKEADSEDFKKLFTDLEGAAKELGLWPEELDKFVTEAIASADLFMYHADGNESASAEELTEYAINALHSFSIADKVHIELQKNCDLIGADGQSFTVNCFREYFLNAFFNELKYERYYNKLYEYLQLNGTDEVRKYVINIELYSRVDPNPEVPISKEDLNRILVILTSLESAYLRFDIDKDGVLNRGELDLAFLVFKNLVIKVADLGNSGDGLYKSIFLYLVKNMEVPKPLQLIWFHVFGKKKNITSTRYNISAILKNFNVSE